jgi:hypothetical protein
MPAIDGSSRVGLFERLRRGGGTPSGRRGVAFALVVLTVLMADAAGAAGEPVPAAAPTPAAEGAARFSAAQIEQLVAPIALYPDALTVQVLMAATYPLEIVEAARWRAKNPGPQGDALDKALESRDWDPSVESLTHFPDLLQRMSDNLDWTKDLGDAFLGQKNEVLDAVQRMRAKAYEAGTLKTTKEQVVTREVVNQKEIIVIQPADPQVVYVPQYSPSAAYGPSWGYPSPYYPAMMAYPPGYLATTSLLSFGAGMAVGAAIWGDCDWGNHDVYNNNYYGGGGGGGGNQNVNINRDKTVNRGDRGDRGRDRRNGGGREKWQHNPEHRSGVRYRDEAAAKKFGGNDQVAARDRAIRDAARGFDRSNQPGGGARPSQTPAGGRSPQPGASRPGAGQGQGGGRVPRGSQPGGRGEQRPGERISTARHASRGGRGTSAAWRCVRRLRERTLHPRGQHARCGEPGRPELCWRRRWRARGRRLRRRRRGRWRPRGRTRRWRRRPWRRRGPWRTPMKTTTMLVLLFSVALLPATTRAQGRFPSPETAARTIEAATRANDPEQLKSVLGPGSDDLVSSGDPVDDARARKRFAAAAGERTRIERTADGAVAVLHVGRDDWPFPIPIVREGEEWHFDTAAGKSELLNRRIGRNKLATIAVCRAYVDAQYEYASRFRRYAQLLRSTPGEHDGLYWEASGRDASPLGPLVAGAAGEGYNLEEPSAVPVPYHGYFFRILKAQGAHAPDGARDYVKDGQMTGGFAFVAWPAEHGSSGVMTFLVGPQDVVFQKDLGEQTDAAAKGITTYDPDESWVPTK